MNPNVLNALSQPTNHVAQAYTARTEQLDKQRRDEQTQKDNDMLRVFEYAGDGRADEARYYAQAKGLEVPDQIYTNADFAKGLTMAGKLYGDDPVAAQKFTQAWMSNPGGDLQARVTAAQQAAGAPIDPNDREYQRKMAFEIWKRDNFPSAPNTSRFEAGQEAYDSVIRGGISSPEQADQARQEAYKYWDQEYGGAGGMPGAGASPGLVGGQVSLPGFGTAPPLSVRNNNPGNMRPVGASAGFQQFDTPQAGMDAMRQDLAAKISGNSPAMAARFGQNYAPTLANVIATWAPPEENNTAQYVMYVSQQTGIGPNQPLSLQDIDRLVPAMIQMEGGAQAGQYFNASAPAPSAPGQQQIPSGLPQGSVMIGTANGRAVYQAPNGERFIDDGNP